LKGCELLFTKQGMAIQTAVGKDEELASSPTLCRFENFADRQMCRDMSKTLVESFKKPSKELI